MIPIKATAPQGFFGNLIEILEAIQRLKDMKLHGSLQSIATSLALEVQISASISALNELNPSQKDELNELLKSTAKMISLEAKVAMKEQELRIQELESSIAKMIPHTPTSTIITP